MGQDTKEQNLEKRNKEFVKTSFHWIGSFLFVMRLSSESIRRAGPEADCPLEGRLSKQKVLWSPDQRKPRREFLEELLSFCRILLFRFFSSQNEKTARILRVKTQEKRPQWVISLLLFLTLWQPIVLATRYFLHVLHILTHIILLWTFWTSFHK